MAWHQWKAQPNGKKERWGQPARKAAKNEVKDSDSLISFDGKRVKLEHGSGHGGSSSAPACSLEADKQLQALRACIRGLADQKLIEVTPDLAAVLQVSEADKIRDEQKVLNQRRKQAQRMEKLEKQMQEDKDKFESWKISMTMTIEKDEERFMEKQKEMSAELRRLRHLDKEMDTDSEKGEKEDAAQELAREQMEENNRLRLQLRAAQDEQQKLYMQHQEMFQQMQQWQSWMQSNGLAPLGEATASPMRTAQVFALSPEQNPKKPEQETRETKKAELKAFPERLTGKSGNQQQVNVVKESGRRDRRAKMERSRGTMWRPPRMAPSSDGYCIGLTRKSRCRGSLDVVWAVASSARGQYP